MICLSISTSSLYSQTTNTEATLVPNAKLRDAAKLIERGKICEEQVKLLSAKIDLLDMRINIKDSIIRAHDQKDTVQTGVVETYKAELENLKGQRDIAVKEMKYQNKRLRRQKRKTVFVGIGTAAVAIGAYFLFMK